MYTARAYESNEVGRATHSEYFVVGSKAVQLGPSLQRDFLVLRLLIQQRHFPRMINASI